MPSEDVQFYSNFIDLATGEWHDILVKLREDFTKRWTQPAPAAKGGAKLDDFERVKTLGTGSFGRVMLVYEKSDTSAKDRRYYAMKMLDKEKIVKMKQVEHIMNEKKILYSTNFSFLVSMAFHFQDNSSLYMVLDFISGGEMFSVLRSFGRFKESHARYYSAQVILAFEYMHGLDIVYR